MTMEPAGTGIAGSDLYYSLLGVRGPRRDALLALHAGHAEILDIPNRCSDPGVARVKLDWWREELTRWQRSEPRHPLGRQLAGYPAGLIDCAVCLARTVDGIELALRQPVPASWAELTEVWRATTGALWATWVRLGDGDAQACELAERLGTISGHFHSVQNARADLHAGHLRLPGEDFGAVGVTLADLVRDPGSERVGKFFALQFERIESGYARTLAQIPARTPRALRPPLRYVAIVRATLGEIAADGYALLLRRVGLTPLRKLWLAWRTR